MSTNPSTFAPSRSRFVDEKGMLTWTALQKLLEYDKKLQNTLTLLGQIASATIIQGRTEGIGTTVVKLTVAGLLEDTDAIAADGVGSPLTGGKRGFLGLDGAGDLSRVVVTDKVIEGSILDGAVALGKQKTDSLARMFTSDALRTSIEAKEPAEVDADETASHLDMSVVVGSTADPTISDVLSTYKDIPEMTKTVNIQGGAALIIFRGSFVADLASLIESRVMVDAVAEVGSDKAGQESLVGAAIQLHTNVWVATGLSAGNRIFKMQGRTDGSTVNDQWESDRRTFIVVGLT
ncbi:hypothetical protein LCGC14_0466630 [marine sediment metagenome]|uniref:Major capsid protein n=1 Tax=marine sediment metagenome TaxID=412755 RepID=A0A0F9VMA1_9ZZZZ